MSMNETVSAERIHIGFFGLTNAGKSSVVNAVTGQQLAVVSEVKGTTTDPVRKAMELLPLGPVVIIDTPGIDDAGTLGALRVERTRQVLDGIHMAVLVVDAVKGLGSEDQALLVLFEEKRIPHLVAYNKADLLEQIPADGLYVSAVTGLNIDVLKERMARLVSGEPERRVVGDLVAHGDVVILVTPIDASAPKGRLILPQQQTIRDLLDAHAIPMVVQEQELPQALCMAGDRVKLVITDSQAFGRVGKMVPPEVPLTSFSILFARYKGDLNGVVRGAAQLDRLRDGDRVLISEGCTHHRQCEDIGTVKLPKWIRDYTGRKIEFSFTSGRDFPHDLSQYALIVHCGGCTLNAREMRSRLDYAAEQEIPMTNYGIAIAHINGILARSIQLFPEAVAAYGK